MFNLSRPRRIWRTRQTIANKSESYFIFWGGSQNKRINLTNPVLVSRWIAPNKVRWEYQWGFKITKYLQNSILHHSKQEQRNMFPIGKFTTIGLQQHQYLMFKLHSSAHELFTLLNMVQWFIINHLNNKRHTVFELFRPKVFLAHSFSLTLWSQFEDLLR